MHQTRIHAVFAAVIALALFGLTYGVPRYVDYLRSRRALGIQSAARADLAMLLERETDFFNKNGFFTTDLALLSLDAPKPLIVLYKFGFVRPAVDSPARATALDGNSMPVDSSRTDLDQLLKMKPAPDITMAPDLTAIEMSKLASFCPDCTASKTGFKAVVAANLDDDPTLDVWTINEKGVIEHVVDDL